MTAKSRFLLSAFLLVAVVFGALLPAAAEEGTPEASPVASPVAVDPALVEGFGTAQGNFARTGEVDVAGPAGNPVLRWQMTLPANAYHAPMSSEGLAFVPLEGSLVAIDLATGEIVWSVSLPGGTASPPTLVDGVIYQTTWGGGLQAIDATSGGVLWTYLWEDEEAGADPPRNASEGSPVVVEGVVYSHGGPWGGVFAVDAATGTELWKVETEGEITGNLAFLDGMLYFAEQAMFDPRHDGGEPGISGLRALDSASGDPVWQFDFPEGTTTFVTPTILDGVVIGGATIPGANLGVWYGIDAVSGEEIWHKDAPAMWFQWLGGTGDLFATFAGVGVHARDLQSGEIVWEIETERFAGGSIALANDAGFVHDNEGWVIAFDATNGDVLWSFETMSTQLIPLPSQVAVTNDLVLATAGDQMYAIEGDGLPLGPPVAFSTYPAAIPVADDFASYATLTDTLTMDDNVPELIQGIAAGPDGTLYAVDPIGGRIVLFDAVGNFLSAFGEEGSGEGQFQFNMDGWVLGDLFVAPDGTIYVADAHNGRVQVFDKDWTFIRSFGDVTVASGIGVDLNSGAVYVGDQEEGVVHVFDAEGNSLGDWGRQGATWSEKLSSPTDVAVGPDGRIYVSETDSGKVRVYSAAGEAVDVLGGWGSEPGRFAGNWGLAFDNDGNLIVTGYGSGAGVSIISSEGTVIGVLDANRTELSFPPNAVAGPDGRIYVSEEGSSEISIYTPGAVAPVASPQASPAASPEA